MLGLARYAPVICTKITLMVNTPNFPWQKVSRDYLASLHGPHAHEQFFSLLISWQFPRILLRASQNLLAVQNNEPQKMVCKLGVTQSCTGECFAVPPSS